MKLKRGSILLIHFVMKIILYLKVMFRNFDNTLFYILLSFSIIVNSLASVPNLSQVVKYSEVRVSNPVFRLIQPQFKSNR